MVVKREKFQKNSNKMAKLIEYYSSCHLFKWQLYRTCKIWPTLILISSLLIQLISTFNLDINLPVYKFGPPDSYFGYSVAEHIIKRSSQSTPV